MATEPKGWYNYVFQTRHGHHRIYSGATNNIHRRIKQHNHNLAGGSHTTKTLGPDNAMIVVLIGPTSRTMALAFEWRLKRTNVRGGGLAGRLRAIVKTLRRTAFRTTSVQLQREDLRRLRISTAMSDEEVANITGVRITELLELIGDSARCEARVFHETSFRVPWVTASLPATPGFTFF